MVTEGDLDISTLTTDQHRAESLLAELAADLRRVPVDGPMRTLHLRALSLKRAVMRWSEEHPEESVRRAVLDEVVAMQVEARDWRRLVPDAEDGHS
jgi:hypothetical protein